MIVDTLHDLQWQSKKALLLPITSSNIYYTSTPSSSHQHRWEFVADCTIPASKTDNSSTPPAHPHGSHRRPSVRNLCKSRAGILILHLNFGAIRSASPSRGCSCSQTRVGSKKKDEGKRGCVVNGGRRTVGVAFVKDNNKKSFLLSASPIHLSSSLIHLLLHTAPHPLFFSLQIPSRAHAKRGFISICFNLLSPLLFSP